MLYRSIYFSTGCKKLTREDTAGFEIPEKNCSYRNVMVVADFVSVCLHVRGKCRQFGKRL